MTPSELVLVSLLAACRAVQKYPHVHGRTVLGPTPLPPQHPFPGSPTCASNHSGVACLLLCCLLRGAADQVFLRPGAGDVGDGCGVGRSRPQQCYTHWVAESLAGNLQQCKWGLDYLIAYSGRWLIAVSTRKKCWGAAAAGPTCAAVLFQVGFVGRSHTLTKASLSPPETVLHSCKWPRMPWPVVTLLPSSGTTCSCLSRDTIWSAAGKPIKKMSRDACSHACS